MLGMPKEGRGCLGGKTTTERGGKSGQTAETPLLITAEIAWGHLAQGICGYTPSVGFSPEVGTAPCPCTGAVWHGLGLAVSEFTAVAHI